MGPPPCAILVDYDGTIALTDVSDTIMAEHADPAGEELAARYDAGPDRLARVQDWQTEPDPRRTAPTSWPRRPASRTTRASSRSSGVPRRAGIPVEVVSDGLGFFIAPALERLGVPELPVIGARTSFANRAVRRSRSRTATRPASCAGRASASGCSPSRPRAGPSCSSATARAIAMRPAMPTSSSPSGCSCRSASRTAGRSERWTEFAEIHAWLNDCSTPGGAIRLGAPATAVGESVLLRPGGLGRRPDGSARRLTRRHAIDLDRSGRPPQRRPLAMNAIRRSDGTLRVEGAST